MDRDYTQAIKLFSEAIALDPQNGEAKFYKALCQLDSGKLKEAVTELRALIQ